MDKWKRWTKENHRHFSLQCKENFANYYLVCLTAMMNKEKKNGGKNRKTIFIGKFQRFICGKRQWDEQHGVSLSFVLIYCFCKALLPIYHLVFKLKRFEQTEQKRMVSYWTNNQHILSIDAVWLSLHNAQQCNAWIEIDTSGQVVLVMQCALCIVNKINI